MKKIKNNVSLYLVGIVSVVALVGIFLLLGKTNISSDMVGESTTTDGSCNYDAHTNCPWLYSSDWEAGAIENGYTIASWKYSLLDCLRDHEVSEACEDSLDQHQAINDALFDACRADRAKYCRGIHPIPGKVQPEIDCLEENYPDLSPECAAALDAHEATKRTE